MNIIQHCIKLVKAINKEKFYSHECDLDGSEFCRKILVEGRVLKFFKVKVEAVLVNDSKNDWYVCFQGSWGFTDWLMNFMFRLIKVVPYSSMSKKSPIKTHYGFIKQYKLVRDRLRVDLNSLAQQYGKPNNIYFTGHSLGGALAVLASLDHQYHGFVTQDRIQMINFGSPKVGNKYFQESFNNRIIHSTRYVNGGDLVSLVPFDWMGYKGVDDKLYIKKNKFPYFSIADHNHENYYNHFFK